MKISLSFAGLLCALLAAPALAQASAKAETASLSAMLRLQCDGDSVGAEVFIDGKFRGECPFDVKVAEGELLLRAVKPVDERRERVFERRLRIGADTISRVEIALGAPQISAAAREAERLVRKKQVLAGQSAATEGDAQAILALAYENGRIVDKDLSQAFALYRQSAEAGSPQGMGGLAAMHNNGWGTPQDYAAAAAWARRAADAGDPRGTTVLSLLHEYGHGGVPQDMARAVALREVAAAAGFPTALFHLGRLYQSGNGVPKDEKKAFELFEQAAEAGWAVAMNVVGTYHLSGWAEAGLAADPRKALSYYQRLAETGDLSADNMANLGILHRQGQGGLPADECAAVSWYRRAADAGSKAGMCNLGLAYGRGWCLPVDEKKSVALMRQAGEVCKEFF